VRRTGVRRLATALLLGTLAGCLGLPPAPAPTNPMRFLSINDVYVADRGNDRIEEFDSTGGFTMVLSALKALLEHDVVLTVVADKAPAGLEL